MGQLSIDGADCLAAIALGTRLFVRAAPDAEPFRLVAIANMLNGAPPIGPAIWELRFKPARLMPADDKTEAGAGGEWRISIDLANPDAAIRIVRED